MCGIVGYIGQKNAKQIILDGLKRLEYRGYDSSGISLLDSNNKLFTFKKEGKLEALLEELKGTNFESCSGVGHTRWATHGEVNSNNAHPHAIENFSLVHNGIIENSETIKSSLKEYSFISDTDSEVFLALFSYNLKNLKDIRSAFIQTFKKVEGHSAFVLLSAKTNEIFAIRKGAPLVCGIGKGNYYVSSDPYGLVGEVDEIVFPEDEVICHLSSTAINFLDLSGKLSNGLKRQKQKKIESVVSKGNFEHYMLKEIFEQPKLINSLYSYYLTAGLKDLEKLSDAKFNRIFLSACGTASYAALLIRDYFENYNNIFSVMELASEFRYRKLMITNDDLALFISQSGETADTLAAQELCLKNNIETWSIVNTEGSSVYRNAKNNFPIKAGIEIGVASTKAFSLQAVTGFVVSRLLGKKDTKTTLENLKVVINNLSLSISNILERSDEIRQIAESLFQKKGYFFTGRGIYYPIALEGALKIKEIAYVHAEAYAAGELKHGPIALIDDDMVNIAFIGEELKEKTISNIKEIKTRKGIILTVGDFKEHETVSDYHFQVSLDGLDELKPVALNIFNQLFAYHVANLKGTDIDQPRNLAKSVTVE